MHPAKERRTGLTSSAPRDESSSGAVPRFFQQLGDRIEAAFRAAGYDEAAFPAIAEAALREAPPSDHLGACDTLEWALTARAISRQANVDDAFGQPAIQVYVTQRWYIEVLHWLDGTTAIHQHGFNGAFHVLAGGSIHARYRFEEERRYGARLRLGRIERESIEVLRAGDVRQIHAGPALIHSLFHLDRPSVTVVARTAHLPDASPQLSYAPPCLAFDPFYRPEQLARQRQSAEALARLGHRDLEALLARVYQGADPFSFAALAMQTAAHFHSEEGFRAAVLGARDAHGELADAMLAVVAEQRRQDAITGLRVKVRSPEHRLLLALLLYFDHGRPILELVSARWPERDPEELVVRWLEDLSDLPDPRRPGRRVFDFELEGPGGAAARAMLGGRPLGEVLEILKRDFDAAEVDRQAGDLSVLQEALRETVFGPLFR
jgi:hypothetical protein